MGVALRVGLQRGGDVEGGAVIVTSVGALVALALAAATGGGEVVAGDLLPFAIAGAFVPGVSSVLIVHAIRHAGASRALIVIGTAPLLSVLLALVLLDEPFKLELAIGTVLIVAAGIVLARETRPEHFRLLGGVLALLCAVMFAGRDNLVRWASRDAHPPPLVATATSLVCAAAVLIAWLVVARRQHDSGPPGPRRPGVRRRRPLPRAGLFGAGRGPGPRPRLGRRAAERDPVALGGRLRGHLPGPERGDRPPGDARRGPRGRRRRPDRSLPLTLRP